jgi:ribonuclease Y
MTTLFIIIVSVLAFILGLYINRLTGRKKVEEYERIGKRILEDARKEADVILKEANIQAKDLIVQAKSEIEQEIRQRRSEVQSIEKRLAQKEFNLDRKMEALDEKEEELKRKEADLREKEEQLKGKIEEYESLLSKERERLEYISGISQEEAKRILISMVEEEARHESIKIMKRIEEEARESADKKAKEILALAVQRYAGDYVGETTVSVVPLPNDEMKGRIIGREGRNIRAFEAATGVDVIIDDTPEAVILSCFNPIRREIARIALERLISDGRIHPARIEEIVVKVTQEMEERIKEAGERALFDLGIHNVHPEIVRLIGRLKFRTSYAQNVYQHSIEVAFLAGIIAAELRIDVKEAKRAGLFHDIGKAVDQEVEGSHAFIGAELARRYGENEKIVHAILSHHEDVEPRDVLDIVIQAADALSGARPGARREMFETYIRRLEDLERIAMSFKGVEKSFALQAGREIRLIVKADEVSDEDAFMLSKEVAKKIESELSYPGQIKVVVIRETRAVEYAK